ncbi:MAG: diaminopropionate ammonia-lyase, partial [Pseudomonadota bacterium]
GGAYAVQKLLQREMSTALEREVDLAEIRAGALRDKTQHITVATATDGNHGRSVAWGAQQFGCACVVYIHAEVSEQRQAAIEAFGARVVRVNGNYDVSVQQAQADAYKNGWFIVSDTSYEGYVDLPRYVSAGYTLFMDEVFADLERSKDAPPTHVFIQGGVGGLASAVCGFLWQKFGRHRPHFVVVEPKFADCLYQSARAGTPTAIDIKQETVMAGLSCGEVSLLGWEILEPCVDDYLTINDELVAPCMRLLAAGHSGSGRVVAGESAVAGLAGLIACAQRDNLRDALGLNESSRVFLLGSEGATDPDIYRDIVGCDPQSVAT